MARRGLEELTKGGEDVLWRKLVGKYHGIVDGKKTIIVPGDTFRAPADKFKGDRTWELVEEKKEEPKRQISQESEAKFRKILVGDGLFDVVNKDGKALNKKPLTEKEADALVAGK
jgi:hypothetical protein